MIEEISFLAQPDWLTDLTSDTMTSQPFPLHNVLEDSLYYPGAGTDGKPVRWLAGNTYSFVYTDYMVSRQRLIGELADFHSGFRGYRVLGMRDLTKEELIPHGWQPMFESDQGENPMEWQEHFAQPFGMWLVFQRETDYLPEHGPERFSLLFLCAEGVASYQALYNSNHIKPKILFLIQHGFGCNWTNFEKPDAIFAKSVAANPAGMPDWLVGRSKAYPENHPRRNESNWPCYYPCPFVRFLDGGHGYAIWALGEISF